VTSLANLPAFGLYFGASLVLLAAFLALYTLILPGDEWGEIRRGNTAAAVALGSAMVGFCLPLASAIVHSGSWADMVVWAAITLAIQLAGFAAMRLLRRDVPAAIARGDMAQATLLAAQSISLGMLTAACLS
jgi:putative membrane protein